ncbi:MAG: UvrD-helicase domain-containing protein [Thermaceae bacterium]
MGKRIGVIQASAGTGKTHALVEELLRERIGSGLPPHRVALVTFSRRAAEELLARVLGVEEARGASSLAPPFLLPPRPFVGTIHGFLRHLLALTAPVGDGLVPEAVGEFEASLVFEEEARSYLLETGHSLDLEELMFLFRKRAYAWPFRAEEEELRESLEHFRRILERYRRRMGPRLAPPDLEHAALERLKDQRARRVLKERYPLILVDEYQDTSPLQAKVFLALAEAGSEVVVVGDPKQSIYGFRNADPQGFREVVERGEVIRTLSTSHRHLANIQRFLNAFTRRFLPQDHLEVRPKGEGGLVEVHWVVGASLEKLRPHEARLLAGRLKAFRERGFSFSEMAVLVRARASLEVLEKAFGEEGVPYVVVKGRGFFSRPEVRAVYRALSYAVYRRESDLFALLTGPYFGLSEPARFYQGGRILVPEEHRKRLEELEGLVNHPPLEALKRVIQDGDFQSRLDGRARQNLDALLLQAGAWEPGNLEALLLWLARRVEDPEAGEVPEDGEGVQLITVHGAKGLEFRLVALFDLGRNRPNDRGPGLWVGKDGLVRRGFPPGEDEEETRLLYVALSRAKEVLLVSGSLGKGKASPWVQRLIDLGYGPENAGQPEEGVWVFRHDPLPKGFPRAAKGPRTSVRPKPLEPIQPPSGPLYDIPSRADSDRAEEFIEGEGIAGRSKAVGILTHWAIAENLKPDQEDIRERLSNQEVVLFLPEGERPSLVEEVLGLLRSYWSLMETGEIPPLERREEDYPELPLVLQEGETTWAGVADRVYRVGEEWFLEDYKTDREVQPERYGRQLELYQKALEQAWGVRPRVRLVFLRQGRVVERTSPV